MRERLLIIGNGMASVRLLQALLRLAPGRFAITIIGAEPKAGYNRVLLSALLAGDISEDDIILKADAWYRENGVERISACKVSKIDTAALHATLSDGRRIGFDQCVLTTGSHPIRLPIPGMEKSGVITFRDLEDVSMMETAALAHQRVAVIGGGLLGIEAAYGLAKRGAKVTLVHVMDRLMERQLDAPAAMLVRKALERKGVKVLLNAQTREVTGQEKVTGLAFADGSTMSADLVICAVGIRPNADLAQQAGLDVKHGIIVDDAMATSVARFHAIGECAEHRGIAYGLVEPAYAQAEVLAQRLIGNPENFEGMVLATNLKVSGLPVFSAGRFMDEAGLGSVILREKHSGIYRKLVFEGARLVGCVLVGETEDALWYLDLIRSQTDITSARRQLIHGRAFAENLLTQPANSQAA